jgi:hypothetical protein
MPKKAKPETPAEQSARFVRETEALIAAGDLSPTDGERALDALVKRAAKRPDSSAIQGGGDS